MVDSLQQGVRHEAASRAYLDANKTPVPTVSLCMNEYSQPSTGKISLHGNGMGAPTPEMVEKRAREIALIDERDPEEFTEDDWQQARLELTGHGAGEHAPEEVENAPDPGSAEHEMVPESHGHRAPRAGVDDDEMLGEQLVSGGVEEAVHDQMLQARREELAQEGGRIEGV